MVLKQAAWTDRNRLPPAPRDRRHTKLPKHKKKEALPTKVLFFALLEWFVKFFTKFPGEKNGI